MYEEETSGEQNKISIEIHNNDFIRKEEGNNHLITHGWDAQSKWFKQAKNSKLNYCY